MAGPSNKAVNQSGVRKALRDNMSKSAAFKEGRTGKGIGGKNITATQPNAKP